MDRVKERKRKEAYGLEVWWEEERVCVGGGGT